MKFTLATVLAVVGLVSAVAIEDDFMAAIRRDSLFGRKAVTSGKCCVEGVSEKEDACNDGTGAAGVCVPDDEEGCGGALTCVALTEVFCNAAEIERGEPTCRRVAAGQTANGVTVARTGTKGA